MIYLDNAATSFYKPPAVSAAVLKAMQTCANPGRGGYGASVEAARTVYRCRELAADMFECLPEQVVFTGNCTHGLNIAIRTLVRPGNRVVVSGFEHNAVMRPLYALGAKITVAGRKLFDPADTLNAFAEALEQGVDAAVFTHVSNVFGYILPVEEMSQMCRQYGVPFMIDAAQSAGSLPVSLRKTGADFIAMPGHKGLLGPQGTGLLLCGQTPEPLLFGGTGSASLSRQMPEELPDRAEAGTVNVPGIAGLGASLSWLRQKDLQKLMHTERLLMHKCAEGLRALGMRVFTGECQSGVVSFVPQMDCEDLARQLAQRGIAVRAGLHCAPLAHESADTLDSGTVRVSFGCRNSWQDAEKLLNSVRFLVKKL